MFGAFLASLTASYELEPPTFLFASSTLVKVCPVSFPSTLEVVRLVPVTLVSVSV